MRSLKKGTKWGPTLVGLDGAQNRNSYKHARNDIRSEKSGHNWQHSLQQLRLQLSCSSSWFFWVMSLWARGESSTDSDTTRRSQATFSIFCDAQQNRHRCQLARTHLTSAAFPNMFPTGSRSQADSLEQPYFVRRFEAPDIHIYIYNYTYIYSMNIKNICIYALYTCISGTLKVESKTSARPGT